MRTRRNLFGAFVGGLLAALGRGQAAGQETESLETADPRLTQLLRKLRDAKGSGKTAALEAAVEELARRQQLLNLELQALESRTSFCPCPEEEIEEPDVEECRWRKTRGRPVRTRRSTPARDRRIGTA